MEHLDLQCVFLRLARRLGFWLQNGRCWKGSSIIRASTYCDEVTAHLRANYSISPAATVLPLFLSTTLWPFSSGTLLPSSVLTRILATAPALTV